MQEKMRNTEPTIGMHTQSDGYRSHYRRWGAPTGNDVVVLLHGGISHAEWQAPLAEAIVSSSDMTFIALDRRGSGLNSEHRGHLISEQREIDDIVSFLHSLTDSFTRIHMAGWCFGGQVASVVASHLAGQSVLSSLILVAPGYVFNERYSDVLRLSMRAVFEVVQELALPPDPLRAFVPVPLQPTDFTDSARWLQFINEDKLRLTRVTASTVSVWNDLADRSRTILSDLGGLHVLAVLGRRDRLVDNDRVAALLREHVRPTPVIEFVDAHHAIQFDEPVALAAIITRFVSGVVSRQLTVSGAGSSLAAASVGALEA
jgi:pimeloyl-ACP methyl ester carboxylesterase